MKLSIPILIRANSNPTRISFGKVVRAIRKSAKSAKSLNGQQIHQLSLSLKYRAMTESSLSVLIPQAFGLMTEVIRRQLGLTLFDCQLIGGTVLAREMIAEMKTGEGKTLTASLPTYIHALTGKRVHVVTVNDYLAERDHQVLGPVYEQLGLSTGVILNGQSPDQRRAIYRRDIVYGTAKEIGFDFLRDRLARRTIQRSRHSHTGAHDKPSLVQPDGRPYFALIDEVDSILLDEASTPLIIGEQDPNESTITENCFRWAADIADQFNEKQHYEYDKVRQRVELTHAGHSLMLGLPGNQGTQLATAHELVDYVQNAIKVRRDFHLDQHYAIDEGKVVIIDEFTGRPAEGRQWQQGIHQSVEARENLELTPATRTAARVTVQELFKRYEKFAGMTGTAWSSRREFKRVFEKQVMRVPTNRPVNRHEWPSRIYVRAQDKYKAVVAETQAMLKANRAVLIGTRSVEVSETIARLLDENDVPHSVLNARYTASEAEIVKQAGQLSAVTVATNMAGRGTDIKLDPQVRKNGGLHVILTEIHESQRIDWQLIGRGSRQGDPGSFRVFLSLEDEILRQGTAAASVKRLQKRFGKRTALGRALFGLFRRAQLRAERKKLTDRMILLRKEKERLKNHFQTGQDPYLEAID